jgi:hypothetical protein
MVTCSLSFINPASGGGTGGDTGGNPPPPPALSLRSPPSSWPMPAINPEVFAYPTALGALITELSSPVILPGPVPGDLWS